MKHDIQLLYIDLFCGAGGTSTGVELARINGQQCAKVIACVNHDALAIASHAANHPDSLHFTEDIRTLELAPLVAHVTQMRLEYPNAKMVLWASLECTNFSNAKGGLPRDADSRTLANHLFRYIEALNPDLIKIENVREFMSWGDLDKNGKPISKDAGRSYSEWVENVKKYGYDFDYRILNAADFGARTSRSRFFCQFAQPGIPIAWAEPTHSKNGGEAPFEHLQKWLPVRDVLDLEDEGKTIFDRKKPIVDSTLNRLHSGLVKFVAGGKENWILKYNSADQKTGKHRPPSIDDPCPTVACQNRLGLVKVCFLSKYYGGSPESKNISIDGVTGTVTTIDHHALVTASFFDMQYGHGTPCDILSPARTVTKNPKHQLVTSKRWIVNPQYNNVGGSIDNPCFTLIARMDKRPPSLVTVSTDTHQLPSFIRIEGDTIIYEIYADDTPAMVRIKEFMALYGLVDIKMRMLRVPELMRIMGFPEGYILKGTQGDQKGFIGNAVEVNMARVDCEATCLALMKMRAAA